mmetsp:Transcript_68388/g.164139  ORF Transcript_68388/g.164139 Transcript_68388/m.164139 type:complete len:396 (+) Transcript_68388:65-1252(+)
MESADAGDSQAVSSSAATDESPPALPERSRSRSHGRKQLPIESSGAVETQALSHGGAGHAAGACGHPGGAFVQLSVVQPSGAEVEGLEVGMFEHIGSIKAKLAYRTSTPQQYQRLLHGTKELADERTLAEEGLSDGAVLTFIRCAPTISSLHEILEDDPQLVPFLIEYGADPNDYDDTGWTALHWAADRRFLRVAEAIVGRADFTEVNALGFGRMSALHTAAIRGLSSLCSALMQRPDFLVGNTHSNNGNTALIWAARSGHPSVCKVLLTTEGFSAVNRQNVHGWTALHYAATSGMLEVCNLLLNRPDFDATKELTLCGETALHWAALNGHVDICKLLLEKGVDPAVEDVDGLTALDGAMSNGHKEVQELFHKERLVAPSTAGSIAALVSQAASS